MLTIMLTLKLHTTTVADVNFIFSLILSKKFMRFIRWQINHIKCFVWFSLQNKREFRMSSALKNARRYKDINSFIHINRTTFSAETYFSGSESRM